MALVYGNVHVLRVNNGSLIPSFVYLWPFRAAPHVGASTDSGYNMSTGYLTQSQAGNIYCSRCDFSKDPYYFWSWGVVWVGASTVSFRTVWMIALFWQSPRFLLYMWYSMRWSQFRYVQWSGAWVNDWQDGIQKVGTSLWPVFIRRWVSHNLLIVWMNMLNSK